MRTIPIKDRSQLERVYAALDEVKPSVPSNFYYAADFYLLDKDMKPTTTLADVAYLVAVGETNFTLQVIDGEITRVKGE